MNAGRSLSPTFLPTRWLLGLALVLWAIGNAWAHKPSDSYLSLVIDPEDTAQIRGQWDIALRDLDFVLGLDADDNGAITWGELRGKQGAISSYALTRLSLQTERQACTLRADDLLADQHSDGAYAVIIFSGHCPRPVNTLAIDYRLFFDVDRQHKGLLKLQSGGAAGTAAATSSAVFAADQPQRQFEIGATAEKSRWHYFGQYVEEGTWHIWIGIDHILFLISLLLPAVMYWRYQRWEPVAVFKPAFWEVLKVVTAFTLAHSITLSAATLGWVSLPSRVVESVIALSVVLAALNNLFPRVERARWAVAFGFGLIHGFGFASVLADLGLPDSALLVALLGFNLGVELGQLAIVAAFLPAAYLIRRSLFYRAFVLTGGSLLIAGIAGLWFAERALNLKFMPF